MRIFSSTIEDLGRQLSLNRTTVSNIDAIARIAGSDSATCAGKQDPAGESTKALLPLSAVQQAELANQIEQDQLSVRRIEEIVRETLRTGNSSAAQRDGNDRQGEAARRSRACPIMCCALQDFLRGHLGAKIDIKQKKNNAGQIVIHFANSDDFERIVGRLRAMRAELHR